MSSINNVRHLFFTTSPRTPEKMISEIRFLEENFHGQVWSSTTQAEFMNALHAEGGIYEGQGNFGDPAFSARDRINRAPQALGFVNLKPVVELTSAGKMLTSAKRTEEYFLRQMLKFQLPSIYHPVSDVNNSIFYVRPYVEMMRLIHQFGSLSFDEVMLFGLQLTDYRNFSDVEKKIQDFRVRKASMPGRYKELKKNTLVSVIKELFETEITDGRFGTRESGNASFDKFVQTKSGNMRDYTDACFRYLRSSGLFSISYKGRTLSIIQERLPDVEFILSNTDRNPVFIDSTEEYKDYLFNPEIPKLLTDDKASLVSRLVELGLTETTGISTADVGILKTELADLLESRKQQILDNQVASIKDYSQYSSIMESFDDISTKSAFDIPLLLEWNSWRAMTMLDGGNIKANLKFDDLGQPMSTAQGNMADIECNYDDYGLTVEVTMSSGQRQYEMEGEPVSRHLAKYKERLQKEAFCLFIAPTISEASISHFYMLHKTNITYYGGKSIIVPITLETFKKMLGDSYRANYTPSPSKVKELFTYSMQAANESSSEVEWYDAVTNKAINWLAG